MANQDIVNGWALAGRSSKSRVVDNQYEPTRSDGLGGQYVAPIGNFRHSLADEGAYFVAHNNTIDLATTLAGHPAPVLADIDVTMTKPLVFMRNSAAGSSTSRCYLDYVEIEVITAGANGTSDLWSAQIDTGATRYSSGTVETFTNLNTNMQSTASSDLVVFGGPVVVSAESASVRRIGHGVFKPTIELQNDRYVFRFGQEANIGYNRVAAAATVYNVTLPPVVLGPTDQFLLAIGQVAQDTAGVYKVRCGWWQR